MDYWSSIIMETFDIWLCFRFFAKILIFTKNVDRFLTKILIFWPNVWFLTKIWIFTKLSIFSKNFHFRPKFRFLTKVSILSTNFHFRPKFRFLTKLSILSTKFEFQQQKLDFDHTFDFWPKNFKILTFFYICSIMVPKYNRTHFYSVTFFPTDFFI